MMPLPIPPPPSRRTDPRDAKSGAVVSDLNGYYDSQNIIWCGDSSLSCVLHHSRDHEGLLSEARRVSRDRVIILEDHYQTWVGRASWGSIGPDGRAVPLSPLAPSWCPVRGCLSGLEGQPLADTN